MIALQEIWVRSDFDQVAMRAKEAGLGHSSFFYSSAESHFPVRRALSADL